MCCRAVLAILAQGSPPLRSMRTQMDMHTLPMASAAHTSEPRPASCRLLRAKTHTHAPSTRPAPDNGCWDMRMHTQQLASCVQVRNAQGPQQLTHTYMYTARITGCTVLPCRGVGRTHVARTWQNTCDTTAPPPTHTHQYVLLVEGTLHLILMELLPLLPSTSATSSS